MRKLTVGVVITCVMLIADVAAQQASPDLILTNGKIFTSTAAQPYVQALAIRGERITAVGTAEQIQQLAKPTTKIIDLGGRTVIPGINDAHNHLSIAPQSRVDVHFKSLDPSWPEARQVLAAASEKAPQGVFIYGDIGPTIFHDVSVDRAALDKVSLDHPVILTTFTGHGAIVNSAALAAAKIAENQPDPLGGRYEHFSDGRLSGVLREYAVFGFNRTLANQVPDAAAVSQLRDTLNQAARFGITTIQDMSDAMPPERCVALLEKIPTSIRELTDRNPIDLVRQRGGRRCTCGRARK